ncbi:MAG TPA: hypothetical protein DCG54_09760 [Anaerolineae bacterium]|jgi:hypothetical protein|nr:hypothetical protein [Anaerolineae bacterium]
MYRLIRFGGLTLEHTNQIDDVGSGETPVSYSVLADGGALDNFGAAQKQPGLVDRVAARVLTATSVAGLTEKYFNLLALRGKRDRLYRRLATGEVQWVWARLVSVNGRRDYQRTQLQRVQDVELHFACQDAFWRGLPVFEWLLDDGYLLDDGLFLDADQQYELTASSCALSVLVSSGFGRAPIRAMAIKVTAPGSAISNITIARAGGESITFNGTIAANKVLIIDTGTMQVKNDGVDAYNDLVISPTADMASWFSLLPGSNALTITYTGAAGGSIEFAYHEAWY